MQLEALWWFITQQHVPSLTLIDCNMQIIFVLFVSHHHCVMAGTQFKGFRHINSNSHSRLLCSCAERNCYQFKMFFIRDDEAFTLNVIILWCFFNCRAYSRMSAFYRWSAYDPIRWSFTNKKPSRDRVRERKKYGKML